MKRSINLSSRLCCFRSQDGCSIKLLRWRWYLRDVLHFARIRVAVRWSSLRTTSILSAWHTRLLHLRSILVQFRIWWNVTYSYTNLTPLDYFCAHARKRTLPRKRIHVISLFKPQLDGRESEKLSRIRLIECTGRARQFNHVFKCAWCRKNRAWLKKDSPKVIIELDLSLLAFDLKTYNEGFFGNI